MAPPESTTGKTQQLNAAVTVEGLRPHLLPLGAYNRLKGLGQSFLASLKMLDGDPHYLAAGMAVGVFVGCTPTIPFQTILALLLAFLIRGSKPAAVIGIWVCNPLTLPLFYYGGFKLGSWILGRSMPIAIQTESILHLLQMGFDVTLAMLIGGIFIGILPAVAAYIITYRVAGIAQKRQSQAGHKGPYSVS